ncbi:type II secretion system protein GspG [Akkermansiaceae bacterium]|jgi:hypothetical protein|nr:type II secretion system protein GspG [Akkermansiaceae bacterium]
MKSALLFPLALLLASCQDDQTDSAQNDSSSGSGQSTTTSSAPSEGNQKRSVTPSNRRNVVEQSKIASAKNCVATLVMACDSFYEEYLALPLANTNTIDSGQTSGSSFMAPLLGSRAAMDENPKFQTFFEYKSADDSKKDGLYRDKNVAELFDPWGNHYYLFLNYDYDNRLQNFYLSKEVFFDLNVLAWSNGPDGKSGTPETNADNVYSWTNDS